MNRTVAYAVRKSSYLLFVISLLFSTPGATHEVRPAIMDITVTLNDIFVVVRTPMEPLIAGIDLSAVQDTNDAPQAEAHDALRALPPDVFAARIRADWSSLVRGFVVRAGDQPIELSLVDVSVAPNEDLDLPRDTVLTMQAPLPDNGAAVKIGWQPENGALIVREVPDSPDAYNGYLLNGELSAPIPRTGGAGSVLQTFTDYIVVGFEHIVPKGLDHILFVLGLFFFSRAWKPLLLQVTAFTVAHTITLALAIFGYVSISPTIVEPLIAASIVYIALENVSGFHLTTWRTLVVFTFGLLHGLGFASVLTDFGLSTTHLVGGLIGFNIGVELGQLAVIAAAFVFLALPFGRQEWYEPKLARGASLAIGVVGAFWLLERVFLT